MGDLPYIVPLSIYTLSIAAVAFLLIWLEKRKQQQTKSAPHEKAEILAVLDFVNYITAPYERAERPRSTVISNIKIKGIQVVNIKPTARYSDERNEFTSKVAAYKRKLPQHAN